MKLVFTYSWCNEEASATITVPFEYSSLEDFQFMLLEKLDDCKKNGQCYIRLFDCDINIEESDIERVENSVLTLEDWFERNKEKIK
jgi:hypothetical protein